VRRTAAPAILLLAAGWAATLWLTPFSDERVNDLFVYRSFAEPVLHGQLPYRDVFFEYPPLAAPVVGLPGVLGTGADAFRWAFAGWTFLLALAVVLLCGALAARTRGDARRAMIAAALMPLACGALVRTHFDLAPVALTLGALALIVSARPRLGLAVLGLGVATKGFPLVVAPVALAWLAGRGRRREAIQGALALGAVVAVTSLAALAISADGFADAVSYQVDRPAQVESVPASVLFALDGVGLGEARSVASHRSDGLVHPADGAVTGALGAALLCVVALLSVSVARAAREDDGRRLVLASLAAVLAFAALGRVLSPQFLIWTVPLAALAVAWRMHALAAAVTAAIVLTQVEFPSRYFDLVAREPFPLVLVAARNAALLAALALALRALMPSPLRRQQQLLDRRGVPVVAGLDQHRA
jgi:Glycosyltransferase family 87